ncbi:hypothetical protein [Dictyobacter kobayashii]|nr:hypothetical protein [Dictyobacter kobayashii]
MAFTQDELQSLNTIMEQKLFTQRRDLERTFDLRLQALRREFEQRVTTVQHDLLRTMSRRLNDQHTRTREVLLQKFESQHTNLIEVLEQNFMAQQQQQQQHFEDSVERSLAAQLLAIEQIIHQRLSIILQSPEFSLGYSAEGQPEFDTIEVQTEIPWEELATLVDRALEERLSSLQDVVLSALKELEQALLANAQTLHATSPSSEPITQKLDSGVDAQASLDTTSNIERLEHLVEAMQVAMTSNSALISNRLYHHQQLPLERAHPAQQPHQPLSNSHKLNHQSAQPSLTGSSDLNE